VLLCAVRGPLHKKRRGTEGHLSRRRRLREVLPLERVQLNKFARLRLRSSRRGTTPAIRTAAYRCRTATSLTNPSPMELPSHSPAVPLVIIGCKAAEGARSALGQYGTRSRARCVARLCASFGRIVAFDPELRFAGWYLGRRHNASGRLSDLARRLSARFSTRNLFPARLASSERW